MRIGWEGRGRVFAHRGEQDTWLRLRDTVKLFAEAAGHWKKLNGLVRCQQQRKLRGGWRIKVKGIHMKRNLRCGVLHPESKTVVGAASVSDWIKVFLYRFCHVCFDSRQDQENIRTIYGHLHYHMRSRTTSWIFKSFCLQVSWPVDRRHAGIRIQYKEFLKRLLSSLLKRRSEVRRENS